MQLHPHQLAAVKHAYNAPGQRFFMLDDTGTGKTVQAIEATKWIYASIKASQRVTQWDPNILVVCPAIVRSNWLRELDLWWEGHPFAAPILYGKANESLTKKQAVARMVSYASPIMVTSYNLVHAIPPDQFFSVIILDEAHRLKGAKTKWSKHIRTLITNNPSAAVFALTATPMPDRPQDAHNLLDIVCPGRFGSRYQFQSRYQLYEPDEYATSGKKFYGVNPVHAGELRNRIAAISSRTTKAEIAHLLPPFDVKTLRVKAEVEAPRDWTASSIEAMLYDAARAKIPHVMEWLSDAVESSSHVTVLTHHRDLARKIRDEAQRKFDQPCFLATGELTPEKRNEVLAQAKDSPSAIVVATMDSVGIGIDMTFTPQALFAELSYRPEAMIQALGRFSRLSGSVPSTCRLLVVEGTIDEVIAAKLEEKIAFINDAVKAGQTESALQASLKNDTVSGDWINELRQAAAGMAGDEGGYLEDVGY